MNTKQTALFLLMALSAATGCASDASVQDDSQSRDAAPIAASGAAASHDTASVPKMPATATPNSKPARRLSDPLRGTVQETMDSGGYTYVLVTAGQGKVWAAARKFAVSIGDEVDLAGLQLMRDFRSQSLDRVFEEIQFVGLARVIGDGDTTRKTKPEAPNRTLPPGHPPFGGGDKRTETSQTHAPTSGLPPGHPPSTTHAAAPLQKQPLSGPKAGQIQKLSDGVTVAELFDRKTDLAGKIVRFRGQVVKASRRILGSSWLHIQDGTGEPGHNDITVTSKRGFAAVGSMVVIEGTLGLDKDFGAGYVYAVIVEDATVVSDAAGHPNEKEPASRGEWQPKPVKPTTPE